MHQSVPLTDVKSPGDTPRSKRSVSASNSPRPDNLKEAQKTGAKNSSNVAMSVDGSEETNDTNKAQVLI